MKKGVILYLTIIFMVSVFVLKVSANSDVCVYLNGQKLTFDVAPQIIDGRTMVPMRKIFEELGMNVSWEASEGKITSSKKGTTIVMYVNNYELYKNGVKMQMDVAPTIINGRTVVPLRSVSESLDAQVVWSEKYNVVSIGTNNRSFYENSPNVINYGKFTGEKLIFERELKNGMRYEYSGAGTNVEKYCDALKSIGYKVVEIVDLGDSKHISFNNSVSPATKVYVVLFDSKVRIEVSVNGNYNYEFESKKPKLITNTYAKTPDGFDIYEGIDGVKYVRIADCFMQSKDLVTYVIHTEENGEWTLERYDARADVRTYEGNGNYVTIEGISCIELSQYLDRIYSKIR